MAHGYSSDSSQQKLTNEYQHDRVKMIYIILCFFVYWMKVTPAAEGLNNIHIMYKYQPEKCSGCQYQCYRLLYSIDLSVDNLHRACLNL